MSYVFLWIQYLIDILPQLLQLSMQYLTMLDWVVMVFGWRSATSFGNETQRDLTMNDMYYSSYHYSL